MAHIQIASRVLAADDGSAGILWGVVGAAVFLLLLSLFLRGIISGGIKQANAEQPPPASPAPGAPTLDAALRGWQTSQAAYMKAQEEKAELQKQLEQARGEIAAMKRMQAARATARGTETPR